MKIVKFDLPINGTKVKNIDELRDNLTDEILVLARSGQLERWLRTRQLPEQAQGVAEAVKREGTDKGLFLTLCEVLEVEAHPDDVKAIFDKPPAAGRFIPGATHLKLYENLKSRVARETSENSNNSSIKELSKKIIKIKYEAPAGIGKYIKLFSFLTFMLKPEEYSDGKVRKIYLSKGGLIKRGEAIMKVEIEVIKFTFEIPSPITGVIDEVFVRADQKIYIDQELISVLEIEA